MEMDTDTDDDAAAADTVDEELRLNEDSQRDDESRDRGWLPLALVVLATVLAVASAATTWVREQALDTDAWVAASSEVLAQPEVEHAVAVYVTDRLYEHADVAADLESVLPDALEGLAPIIAGSLRQPATDAVQQLLASAVVATAWEDANRLAHETLVAIIRDETPPNVSTADGAVVLDLGGVLRSVGERLGLSDDALDRIPAGAGQITVFESDELADVQQYVRVLDVLSWFLFVVVVALYALAVYLARGRRRETSFQVGVAVIVGSLVLLAARQVGERVVTNGLVDEPTSRRTATVIADVATEMLRQMAWTGVVVGLVILGVAALLGPHRWAVAVRRWIAAFDHPGALVVGLAVAFVALLAWWSPARVFERWATSLVLIAIVAAAAVALVRTVNAEAAEATASREGVGSA